MKRKIMPPYYLGLFITLEIILHFLFPIKKIIELPYTYAGILLILFGFLIDIWTAMLFKKNTTTILPDRSPISFMRTGTFKFSRNPMYVGMTAILFGVSILLGTLVTFIFPVLFILVIKSRFIPMEEINLEKAFGEEYLNYKKEVRRWV